MSLLAQLKEKLGSAVRETSEFRGDETVVIGPESLLAVAAFLQNAGLSVLSDIAGVDLLHMGKKPRFEVIYLFFGYVPGKARRLRVKVQVPEENLHVPTLSAAYKSADWLERECWDQFGIVFDGHPNLTRILNHEEFVGHPLRKDYPVDGRHVLRRATDLD